MNINSPTAIPSSQHEEMKEEQCIFLNLYLLKHTAGAPVCETGPGWEETATQGPGLLIRQKYARLGQWRIN